VSSDEELDAVGQQAALDAIAASVTEAQAGELCASLTALSRSVWATYGPLPLSVFAELPHGVPVEGDQAALAAVLGGPTVIR
jgi:hypothetical protein